MFEEQLWEKDGKLQTYTNRWEEFVAPEPPLPPLNNVIDPSSENSADVLTDNDENFIYVYTETDPESGDSIVRAEPQGIFADDRYTIQGYNIWADLFASIMGIDNVKLMIEYATSFPEEIFTAMNTYYNNPTLENAQSLAGLLEEWIPLPTIENIIHATSETSALLFNNVEEGNYIYIEVGTDPETGNSRVTLDPQGVFADDRYIIEPGLTAWDDVFGDLTDVVTGMIGQASWFPESIFETLEAVYEDPSSDNIDAAHDALSEWIVVPSLKVSDKAFPVEVEDNPGVKMFLTPNLNNYFQISYTSPEGTPSLEYTGVGDFEMYSPFREAASYLMNVFDEIDDNVERANRNIWYFADQEDGDTAGTIQPECMELVQALFDNPTEDNKDALVTYLSQFDSEYTGDPLISDDEAASTIKTELATLDAAELLAKITAGEPFAIVINQHTYSFVVTLQNTATATVEIKGLNYSAPVSVEGGNVQIGEVTLTGVR